MDTPVPIIIPLHNKGGTEGTNAELRYALRGLERHFKTPFKVVIVGKKFPGWLQGAEWIQQKAQGLKTALRLAAEAYPAGFFWWYDDVVLLRDQSAAEMKITAAARKLNSSGSGWSQGLVEIRERLIKEGYPTADYSHPHCPYWFDKSMVDESFADWPGMAGKFPFESWILNKRRWPNRQGVEKKYYGRFDCPPLPGKYIVNWNDNGWTPELKQWLAERFSEASSFEKMRVVPPPAGSVEQRSRSGIEVHTLRYGGAWWIRNCAPTLDSWAAKHGHKLRVWTDAEAPPEYPDPKFLEIDMLREFLAGSSDWILYVDADVWVDPDANAHPDLKPGFHIMPDPPSKHSRGWSSWARRNFQESLETHVYRNAGVWLCDRKAARMILDVVAPPFIKSFGDQDQWNLWAALANRNGMPLHDLPPDWNSFSGRMTKAHFQHIAGKDKAGKWNRLKEAGLVAEFTRESSQAMKNKDIRMAMDKRHICMLKDLAKEEWQGSRIGVEIGSYKGESTRALIEALNEGDLDHLHVIEINPLPELKSILAKANDSSKVTLHTKPSWDITEIKAADFVFIDGDHRWPAVADTLRALCWGAKVIAMHDSSTWPRLSGCWGSWNAAKMLKEAPGRTWTEDNEDRPGELTFRGFFVSRAC